MSREPIVICIDGPAGSGKSTVAHKIANKLGFIHLNSGALFRAIVLEAVNQGISLEDEERIVQLAEKLNFSFELSARGETLFLVDGREPSRELYSSETGLLASAVAVLPKLRKFLLQAQRDIAAQSSIVVEGRDAGTVVFPEASFKFYLDATLEERANRRFAQLQQSKSQVDRESIRDDLLKRDRRDETRAIAPQVAAEDAIRIDTSDLNISQVVEVILDVIRQVK
jgi:cytidylate kinase